MNYQVTVYCCYSFENSACQGFFPKAVFVHDQGFKNSARHGVIIKAVSHYLVHMEGVVKRFSIGHPASRVVLSCSYLVIKSQISISSGRSSN